MFATSTRRRAVVWPLVLLLSACSGGDSPDTGSAPVIKVNAEQWEFSPNVITLKKGVSVDLELTSLDVHHRFYLPDFGIDEDIVPSRTTTVRVTPDKTGTFRFRCEYYCGQGHEGMVGHLVVQ